MTPLFVSTGDAVARVADGRAEIVLERPGAQSIAALAATDDGVVGALRDGQLVLSDDQGFTPRED